MATLKSFSIAGLKLWFYSNDHEPPHFHAKRKGEWEYRVHFLAGRAEMFELVWSKKKTLISKADRESLEELVEKHRSQIFKEWEQK